MRTIYNAVKGTVSSLALYSLSQKYLNRDISGKYRELQAYYRTAYPERRRQMAHRLENMLQFSAARVPYYRDLFASIGFDPASVQRDIRYLEELPFLTKDVIIEQGHRLVRDDLGDSKVFTFKTGGSTGDSALIHYDQDALDWSSATTLFARNRIGHKLWKHETHFASRFPEQFPLRDRLKEGVKCFVMNRSNVFFDALDESGLRQILAELRKSRPFLVHAHPSTLYALALYCRDSAGCGGRLLDVFESSGELLDAGKREVIEKVMQCRVVDRYGLAEFGVAAYQLDGGAQRLQVFDSLVYPESRVFDSDAGVNELVFTGLSNFCMPLIRYRTGDCGEINETDEGLFLGNIAGRVHDMVELNDKVYPTHYIQDVLDRIGGVSDFQIVRSDEQATRLRLVPELNANVEYIEGKVRDYWGDTLAVEFIGHADLVRVGWRGKFRYVVDQ